MAAATPAVLAWHSMHEMTATVTSQSHGGTTDSDSHCSDVAQLQRRASFDGPMIVALDEHRDGCQPLQKPADFEGHIYSEWCKFRIHLAIYRKVTVTA